MWRVPHSKSRPHESRDEEKNDDDGDELEKRRQRIVRLASRFLREFRGVILFASRPAPRREASTDDTGRPNTARLLRPNSSPFSDAAPAHSDTAGCAPPAHFEDRSKNFSR